MPRPTSPQLPGYPRLAEEIEASPYTQRDVAIEAGYTPSTFSRYLSGSREAPEDFVARARAAMRRLEREAASIQAALRERRRLTTAEEGDPE